MLNESIFSVKNPLLTPPPSLLPRPPPEPSEAKLSPSIIEQELSVTRRTLKADGRLFNAERRFQFGGGKLECVCVSLSVYVFCMFYWFFKVCGFFIFILVSLFFFSFFGESKEVYLKESKL